ncbi:hypothetical protein J6590_007763 [Homalodisca vitripennis]|nr:hypothetical protein J6590_007763 [Homalodisca vitripennis]
MVLIQSARLNTGFKPARCYLLLRSKSDVLDLSAIGISEDEVVKTLFPRDFSLVPNRGKLYSTGGRDNPSTHHTFR